jgi:hypothetical protein
MMFVTYILARYVRPSSSGLRVRWDDDEGGWVSCEGASDSEVGDELATGHMARRRSSQGGIPRLRRGSLRPGKSRARNSLRGSVALSGPELFSDSPGSLVTEASQPDVVIAVPADTAPPLTRSLTRRFSQSVNESLSGDLLGRYAHFFDAYLSVRGAWLTLPLLLLQQFVMAAFLGLAVPSGGCGYEQVCSVAIYLAAQYARLVLLACPLTSAGWCCRHPRNQLAPPRPDATQCRCGGVLV